MFFFFKIKREGNLTNWLGGFDKMKDKTYDNKYVNNVLAIIGDNIRKARGGGFKSQVGQYPRRCDAAQANGNETAKG